MHLCITMAKQNQNDCVGTKNVGCTRKLHVFGQVVECLINHMQSRLGSEACLRYAWIGGEMISKAVFRGHLEEITWSLQKPVLSRRLHIEPDTIHGT